MKSHQGWFAWRPARRAAYIHFRNQRGEKIAAQNVDLRNGEVFDLLEPVNSGQVAAMDGTSKGQRQGNNCQNAEADQCNAYGIIGW
jgi:hypothetical protein